MSAQPLWATDAHLPLPPALGAPRVRFDSGGLVLALSVFGEGGTGVSAAPLLLIHGMGMGASAMEMRPIFDHFGHPDASARRTVAAVELPGFGSSQRQVHELSPQTMVSAIVHALEHLEQRGRSLPADVCALGLSCEFAVCAALQRPRLFRSLALISPTGLEGWRHERYDDGRTRVRRRLRSVLSLPAIGQLLFRSLSSRTALRQQFERLWDSPLIDEDLLDYSHRSALLPAARHAPLALLCGALSTRGVVDLYRRVSLPVWVAHGTRGAFSDLDALGDLAPSAVWSRQAYDTGAMPHYEHAELFNAHYGAFLEALDKADA